MAKYPIKMLLDEFKRPFFPLVTIDTIVTNNSDKTLKELFEDRYTKAEVDKIISDLGTLQRLRGTVNSYEELLAIENPIPGDTYILLVESGINAEYMYIGDRWEMLGTTATYTDVYSKEVIDRMLLALKQEVNTKAELDDAEVLSQAKIYAEDLFANVPRPNLDDYYKKSEADAKIDEKINAIELPIASANTLGTIKVGANLSIDADGTLNADASGSGTGSVVNGESLPIGSMIPFGSVNNIPANWRICDGSAVSRTAYADLFNVIGTSYGEGDGTTTFNLPNKKGRNSVGLDLDQVEFNNIGLKGGENKVALTIDELPEHRHTFRVIKDSDSNSGGNLPKANNTTGSNGGWSTPVSVDETNNPLGYTGGNQAHNNLQPYEVDVWIIKVSNVVSSIEETTGIIIDNLTSTSTTDALSANMGRELNERLANIGGSNSNLVNYTDEEQFIGYYNGDKLYRKRITGTVNQTYADTWWANVPINRVKALVNFGGSLYDTSDTTGNSFSTNYHARMTRLTSGNLRLDINDNYFANKYFDCWVEYTRAT